KTIKDATRAPELRAQSPKAEALIKTALEVHARFKALDDERDFADISAAEAGRLVNFVRLKGVPSIMELIGTLSSTKKAHDTAVQGVMRERLVKLDKMFTEVEDIGRMIHLISLNASVEAARAGGESGRSFKVIADEIRGLAQQASVLIDTTREGVLPGSDSDPLALNLR
ncbi:MAG: methyl-accepting chemotaxis protein, partial [Pseudomonadota bacterium]